ncbi:MAG: hypothetical protein NTU74_02405 [Deltaproteobacteria bacterium]|nr:hypothetical protein [Deltaproteobacteria bacterium]
MQENETNHKKAYEAPQLYRIIITPDELARTACKSNMVGTNLCKIQGSPPVNRQKGS